MPKSSNSPSTSHIKDIITASPLPDLIYFDTSFIFTVLVKEMRYHRESLKFIERLTKKQPAVVMSQLVRSELWNGILTLNIKDKYGKSVHVEQVLKHDPTIVDQFYPDVARVDQDFSDLMQRFTDWVEFDINETIIKKAFTVIKDYRLRTNDAIHIATMLEWGIIDICAFDWAIEDIESLNIWTYAGIGRLRKRSTVRQRYAARKTVK